MHIHYLFIYLFIYSFVNIYIYRIIYIYHLYTPFLIVIESPQERNCESWPQRIEPLVYIYIQLYI
jgi:hypothetical protein